MADNPPYDGTRIFKPVRLLEDLVAGLPPVENVLRLSAGQDTYRRVYAAAAEFLQQQPMFSLDDAAQKLGVSKEDYIQMADRGEALLIEFEGRQYVPACSFGKDGKIDPLKIDIAREFVLEGRSYFEFMDYMMFMNTQKMDIADLVLSPQQLSGLFNHAGLAGYRCAISVEATMSQLADQRHTLPQAFDRLTGALDSALTHGGWDPAGGLSRPFRDKYAIAGLTIHEKRRGVVLGAQKNRNRKIKARGLKLESLRALR
jgi:hypothetical protein